LKSSDSGADIQVRVPFELTCFLLVCGVIAWVVMLVRGPRRGLALSLLMSAAAIAVGGAAVQSRG
jgi:hypothetical protein